MPCLTDRLHVAEHVRTRVACRELPLAIFACGGSLSKPTEQQPHRPADGSRGHPIRAPRSSADLLEAREGGRGLRDAPPTRRVSSLGAPSGAALHEAEALPRRVEEVKAQPLSDGLSSRVSGGLEMMMAKKPARRAPGTAKPWVGTAGQIAKNRSAQELGGRQKCKYCATSRPPSPTWKSARSHQSSHNLADCWSMLARVWPMTGKLGPNVASIVPIWANV